MGVVGELLLEGTSDKFDHLKNPDTFYGAFIPRPSFLPASSSQQRCYLTGFLCRFDLRSRALVYERRKDAQDALQHHIDNGSVRERWNTVSEEAELRQAIGNALHIEPHRLALDRTGSSEVTSTPPQGEDRFELLGLKDDGVRRLETVLDAKVGSASLVEDCYPCSSVQEGIVVSQLQGKGTYNILAVWDVVCPGKEVTRDQFYAAWARVVQRHASLRTTIIESVRDDGLFDQVVLRNHAPEVVEMPWLEGCDEAHLLQLNAVAWTSGKPQHRIGYMTAADGAVTLQLVISHAIIDGISMANLHRDLERSLNGALTGHLPSYNRRYIRELQSLPKEPARAFWHSYLDGLDGCRLPVLIDWNQKSTGIASKRGHIPQLRHLKRYCQSQGITLFNLFQAAWALVLRAYTLSDDVCYGFMITDKHLLGDQADNAVGLFISMMLCRVLVRGVSPVADFLTKLGDDFMAALPHQHVSLGEIARDLKIPADQLFNTAMTYFTVDSSSSQESSDIRLNQRYIQDANEVRRQDISFLCGKYPGAQQQ